MDFVTQRLESLSSMDHVSLWLQTWQMVRVKVGVTLTPWPLGQCGPMVTAPRTTPGWGCLAWSCTWCSLHLVRHTYCLFLHVTFHFKVFFSELNSLHVPVMLQSIPIFCFIFVVILSGWWNQFNFYLKNHLTFWEVFWNHILNIYLFWYFEKYNAWTRQLV